MATDIRLRQQHAVQAGFETVVLQHAFELASQGIDVVLNRGCNSAEEAARQNDPLSPAVGGSQPRSSWFFK